jgi:hypothetical protein
MLRASTDSTRQPIDLFWWIVLITALVLVLFVVMARHRNKVRLQPPKNPDALNVLFIGNSLTASNDLPGMLLALIESVDAGPAQMGEAVFGGYGFIDHWPNGSAQKAIKAGGWDVVVMQQGPSATEGRASLIEYSERYAKLCRKAGCEPAMYMVWPPRHRFQYFDMVSESHRLAAENMDGLLFPAGDAWQLAWKRDKNLKLYGGDGFHPSKLGTYLAALVMFEQLTGHSPIGVTSNFKTQRNISVNIDPATAKILQEAAAEANAAVKTKRFTPKKRIEAATAH